MTLGLGPADARELAVLRRRAYGPDGDLDPVGERRLRDLEDRLLDAQAPIPDAAAKPAAADGAPPELDDHPPPRSAAPPGARRRHPVLAALGAVLVAGLLVSVGYLLARPPGGVDAGMLERVPLDPERAAVVAGTASFSVRHLDPDTLVQYATLGQGTPWSASRADGVQCLILTVTDDSPEMIAAAGIWDTECAPAGLSPVIDWRVDRAFPSPPQTLPDGSVVRLTIDGDQVRLSIGRTG